MLTQQILQTLKQSLRNKGITYKQAAIALGLSQSSIKRLFAEQSFTLPRLESLCELAEIDLTELLRLAESNTEKIDRLTLEQERHIADNPKLLLVGVCVINRCSFGEILTKYQLDKTELVQLFAQLDRLNIIEYLPGNRYKLKISSHFNWQMGGPIQRFFLESILQEYMTHEIDRHNNHFHYIWGMLTKETAVELSRKIKRLVDDYQQLAEQENRLPMNETMTSSLLVFFREDWEPSIFKNHWKVTKK